jgi:hydrogenase maturation factor
VVTDAITAFNTGGVTAMHDPTEGGIAGGLHELADASNVGFQVSEESIWIAEETRRICAHFEIDPLQLISSGSLLIVAEEEHIEEIVKNLSRQEIPAAVIGEITEPRRGRKLVTRQGKQTNLTKPVTDQLWTALLQKK